MDCLCSYQKKALTAIADCFFGTVSPQGLQSLLQVNLESGKDISQQLIVDFAHRKSSDMSITESIIEKSRKHLSRDSQWELWIVLMLFSSRIAMFFLAGRFSTFVDLERDDKEYVMRYWFGQSRFSIKRKIFASLKSLVLGTVFAIPKNSTDHHNLNWKAIDYDPAPKVLEPNDMVSPEYIFKTSNEIIFKDEQILNQDGRFYDAVVVGSGCGGSVLCSELTNAGLRVLLLEKAKYYKREELLSTENDGFDKLYERGGLQATVDTGIAVLAGSSLGGGTTVNWACCLDPPDYVLEEWDNIYGLSHFTKPEFKNSLEVIKKEIGVTTEGIVHNKTNSLFIEGCKNLNYHVENCGQNYRNVEDSKGAEYVGVGDRHGIKLSMTETFLQKASKTGLLTIIDQCNVRKVIQENGQVVGVQANVYVGKENKDFREVRINSNLVICSAGAIHTPALLKRSNIASLNKNKNLGKNLRLHPVALSMGYFKNKSIQMWKGKPMSTVSNEFANGPNNDHYGCKLEIPSAHPMIISAARNWFGNQDYKETSLLLSSGIAIISLARDKGSGYVDLDSELNPQIHYQLNINERKSLMQGTLGSIRILESLGCDVVGTGQNNEKAIKELSKSGKERKVELEKFLQEVETLDIDTDFASTVMSAHQMGTCRMGTSVQNSVVDSSGKIWGITGLYIADTSVFPTSTGSNPMLTVLAISHHIAQGIKADCINQE